MQVVCYKSFNIFSGIEQNNFKKMLFISDRIVTSNIFSKKQIKFITRHTGDSINIYILLHVIC